MSITDLISDEPQQGRGTHGDGFGPDRELSLADTKCLTLSTTRSAVSDFVLEQDDGSVPAWDRATERFRRRLLAKSPHEPRFSSHWAKRTRARLLRADEQMREWCECTVLLTFTGRPVLPGTGSQLIPPVQFLQALTESRDSRRAALRELLTDAERWITMRVIGAHESGYAHEHVLVGADLALDETDFEPVISAHRRESPVAGEGAHGSGAISLESAPNRDEPTGGVKYIALDAPGIKPLLEAEGSNREPTGVAEGAAHRCRLATVLEAAGKQAVRIDSAETIDAQWR